MRINLLNLWTRTLAGVLLVMLLTQPAVEAHYFPPADRTQQNGMISRFYYQTALQLAVQGHLQMATDLMSRVYRLKPESFELALVYAEFLRVGNRRDEALDVYAQLVERFEEPQHKALGNYYRSLVYDEQKMTDKAVETMETAIKSYPGEAPSGFYYDLGVLYAKLNRFDKTRLYSQKALEKAPTSAEAWNNLGFSLAKLGEYQQGFSAIQKALELNPRNANALDSMGYILFHMGRFKESILEYEKALELDPRMAESYLYLGQSYEATADWAKAIESYENFLLLADPSPNRTMVEKRLQTLRQVQGKTPETKPLPASKQLNDANNILFITPDSATVVK